MPKGVGSKKLQGAKAARDLLVIISSSSSNIVHQSALTKRIYRSGLPKLRVKSWSTRGRKPSDIICTTQDVVISKATLGASRNTTTIGWIKGTGLLKALLLLKLLKSLHVMLLRIIKLLSREVVIFHIRIDKRAKRRSWRKTGLLL
jgi:hypothetical protein